MMIIKIIMPSKKKIVPKIDFTNENTNLAAAKKTHTKTNVIKAIKIFLISGDRFLPPNIFS